MKRRSFLSLLCLAPLFGVKSTRKSPLSSCMGNSAIPSGAFANAMHKGSVEAVNQILHAEFKWKIAGPTTWRDAT